MDVKNNFVVILGVMLLVGIIYNRVGFEVAVLFCLSATISTLIFIHAELKKDN